MPMITVYTPTYNREKLLPRLYQSLCDQSCNDFLWLIIDDGSTDQTASLIQTWQAEQKITIQYVRKENGGVQTARDMAYHLVETELIVGVDSDDWMPNDAVEKIVFFWAAHGASQYGGIFALHCAPDGKPISTAFPPVFAASYQEFTYKYKVRGDKATILRSDVIKKIPDAPVFPGEKLIGEGYKWIQLPKELPFLILDEAVCIVDYQDDGYSKCAQKNRRQNPNGFRANALQHIVSSKYLRPRLKGQIGYIVYSLVLKDRHFFKNSPKPWQTVLLLPIGLLGYLFFSYKHKKFRPLQQNGLERKKA